VCLLLLVEQQELGACLCRGAGFPGTSGCGVAGLLAGGNVKLQVPTYAEMQDLPRSAEEWSHMETPMEGDQECRAASHSSYDCLLFYGGDGFASP
jgi:hypothetical protein